MRMFLIGMTDIFLILYLTAITNTPSTSVLTVDDFYKLKTMHAELQSDKEKDEVAFAEELAQEQERVKEMEETLLVSDAELEQINQELLEKESMLKSREQLLVDLNQKIDNKEEIWQKMAASIKEESDANKELADKLKLEAQKAQELANQMQSEAELAYKTADTAKAVQQKALILKEEALKEKEEAELLAREALKARWHAEAQKEKAVAAKEEAEVEAQKLSRTIEEIKQEGDAAYANNIRPQLQTVKVTYERKAADQINVYKRELTVIPTKIKGEVYAIFPSAQIGFRTKSDRAPKNLVIEYAGQKITDGRINMKEDLIAIALPGYGGETYEPYPVVTNLAELMPALLALRNNGNRRFTDKIRGLSNEYFIVNRDYIEADEGVNLKFTVTGFRGTGIRAERIVRGDQLVDLNGRLIGVANDDDRIIRMDSLSGWEPRFF